MSALTPDFSLFSLSRGHYLQLLKVVRITMLRSAITSRFFTHSGFILKTSGMLFLLQNIFLKSESESRFFGVRLGPSTLECMSLIQFKAVLQSQCRVAKQILSKAHRLSPSITVCKSPFFLLGFFCLFLGGSLATSPPPLFALPLAQSIMTRLGGGDIYT